MVPRARIRVIVTVVAATGTEARAIRRYATDGITVVQAGIALKRAHRFDGLVISCGLAGGVRSGLPAGTPLIPERVYGPDDREIVCDTQAVAALTRAARDLGCAPVHDPLFTSRTLVHGIARKDLEARGFAGVDMETALLDAPRIACVRVVLDTQEREISPAWLRPWSVLFQPFALRDLPFLLREAPRAADLAARIAVQAAASLHL
ncbi:MAG TPA: hypothetical protein VIO32_12510 [Candidatus Baltobacteraceae bacterium]